MKHTKLFFALCSAAVLFAACEKNDEPNDGSNNNDPKNDSIEAVDLGLSVKWATCNVGATSPEKYGNYYAWGETTTKTTYSWGTYEYGSSDNAVTKYNTDSIYGKVDNKTTLEASDDAATVNWGEGWRMPTSAEWDELIDKCTWEWTTLNGVNGYEVKSKTNDNSIFLPAAGVRGSGGLYDVGNHGYFWSSSLNTDDPLYAWYAYFYSGSVGRSSLGSRCFGRSVRPVCE